MTDFNRADNAQASASALAAQAKAYADLDAAYAALTADLAAARSKMFVQARKILDLTSPSGQAMPQDVPAGWKTVIAEDFDTPCAEGNFAKIYAPRSIGFYPPGYTDTSKRGGYTGQFISTANSVCSIRLFPSPAVAGLAQVASLVPIPPGGAGKWGAVSAMIVEERVRFHLSAGFKAAHMLWPYSNNKYPDGEIDFIEFDPTPATFIHHQGGTKNSDQTPGAITADVNSWHTYRCEWVAGQYVRTYCDGALIVEVTGAKVPATPMRLSLQNETSLNRPVVAGDSGRVETDWVRVMVAA